MRLSFKDEGKYKHPGVEFIDHVGIFQVGITAVAVENAVADLKLGRENENWKIEIEAYPGFHPHINLFKFYKVFGFPGARIGSQVIFEFDPTEHVHPEIFNPV